MSSRSVVFQPAGRKQVCRLEHKQKSFKTRPAMFRLVFIFILGTMMSSPVCLTMVERPGVASDSSGESKSGAASSEEAAPQLLEAPRVAESDGRPSPSIYFDFIPLDEPPPPDLTTMFWKWFVSSAEEDFST
ncbi:hypothetical protein GE061_001334 [Apolygus lucorum]|uniref:Uncharacterized protein n=1 Tax=Apolygus lucorum TaxID=248454 RepID=A0A6A4J2G5_APOLU|nr:hypothetical protein GE061_001334 [Apolygus lucorum]